MPEQVEFTIPLTGWAEARLAEFAQITGARDLPNAATLMNERAVSNRYAIPGKVSAGGGCRIYGTRDGEVAINLARPDDRALLPALFTNRPLEPDESTALEHDFAAVESAAIVGRGREMGLAIADLEDSTDRAACEQIAVGAPGATLSGRRRPRIVDLSSLWAGPLAANLLQMAGSEVVKVENPVRMDGLRQGEPAHFARLNGGKASVALDPRESGDRARLLALVAAADIVIESSRPRALKRLGIDARRLVQDQPGLTWIQITAHGATGAAADWGGFGDDCGVAGGLSQALRGASGSSGFVGDAIGDPLTGIIAALEATRAHRAGGSRLIGIAMSGVVSLALRQETARNAAAFTATLREWAERLGQPFPRCPMRRAGLVAPLGADNRQILGALPC